MKREQLRITGRVLCLTGALVGMVLEGYGEGIVELGAFPVYAGSEVLEGAPMVGQLSERMGREVRVDLQMRGGEGYQSDISIRGGIFEGTGLMVGGLALFDPQTGHYFSEIPLDPYFFSGAKLYTGVQNGHRGFNSTAGTIDWQWAPIWNGGKVGGAIGTDAFYGGRILYGEANREGNGWQLGIAREEGEGSVEDGDFELMRISGRLRYHLGGGELQIFGGYVEKFYGWPGMYTGFRSLSETEDYSVSLVGWQWQSGLREGGAQRHEHRIGGYWRQLEDDYEFNRYQPNQFFEHQTEVWSLQGDGYWEQGEVEISYVWVFLHDRLERSTSLVNGHFVSRDYIEGSVLANRGWDLESGRLELYGGTGIDTTNRDETIGTPQAGLSYVELGEEGEWRIYAEYSMSSQVPGYTVLNSNPTGLFGGNPNLGREKARTAEAGLSYQNSSLTAQVVVFQREDEDLVDWVYDSGSPSARQASAVDITVKGLETFLRWERGSTALEAGFALLDKDPRYKTGSGDASFYALNYAEERLLAGIEQTFREDFTVLLQGEYREHPANALRSGGNEAVYLNLHVIWRDFPSVGWQLHARLDNLTGEDFEPIPGTPGPEESGRLTLLYSW